MFRVNQPGLPSRGECRRLLKGGGSWRQVMRFCHVTTCKGKEIVFLDEGVRGAFPGRRDCLRSGPGRSGKDADLTNPATAVS